MAVDKSSIKGLPEGALLQAGKVRKVYVKVPVKGSAKEFVRDYIGEVIDDVYVPYEKAAPKKAKKAAAAKAEKKAEKKVEKKPAKAEEKPAKAEAAPEKAVKKPASKKVIPIAHPLPVFKKWDDKMVNQLLDDGYIEEAAQLVMNGNPSVIPRGFVELFRFFSENSTWACVIKDHFGEYAQGVMGVANYYLLNSWRKLGEYSDFRAIAPGATMPLEKLGARLEKIRKEKVTKRDRVGRNYIVQVFHGENMDVGLCEHPFFVNIFDIANQSSVAGYTVVQENNDTIPGSLDLVETAVDQLLNTGSILKGANPLLTLDANACSLAEAMQLGKNNVRSLTFLCAADLGNAEVQALIDKAAPRLKVEAARGHGKYASVTVPLNDPAKIQAHIFLSTDAAVRERVAKEFAAGLRAFETMSPLSRIQSDWRRFFVLDKSGNILSRREEMIEVYRRQAGHWVLLTNGVPDAQLAMNLYSFAYDQQSVVTGFCRAAYGELPRHPMLDDPKALVAMVNTMVSFSVFTHNSLDKKMNGTELYRQVSLYDAFRFMMSYALMRHENGTFFNMVGPEGKRFLKALGLDAKDRVND